MRKICRAKEKITDTLAEVAIEHIKLVCAGVKVARASKIRHLYRSKVAITENKVARFLFTYSNANKVANVCSS